MKNTFLRIICLIWCITSFYHGAGIVYAQQHGTSTRETLPMVTPAFTDQEEQHETLPVVAASTDSLVKVTTRLTHTYVDTIRLISYKRDSLKRIDSTISYADSTDLRGHYVEAYIGGGYGSLGYGLRSVNETLPGGYLNRHEGSVSGGLSLRLQAQYAYFFHTNWGVGAGLWFENISSTARLQGDFAYLDRTDTNGEKHYNHHIRVYSWREKQTIYNLAIPISVQTQWWNDKGTAGFFADLGIAPTFSIAQHYYLQEADVEHFGYYPRWELTLEGMTDHNFSRNTDNPTLYTSQSQASGKMSIHPMATLFVDMGALLKLNRQFDLFVGAYAHFTPNDANASSARPFGWQDEQQVGPSTFMAQYEGLYATEERAGKTHPWVVGLKVGMHWHHFRKPVTHYAEVYDYFVRQDTSYRTQERTETELIERIDTFQRTPQEQIQVIQKKVDRLNKIYFAFDSYYLNNKSKRYLRDIYEVLKGLPNHIIIGGHASEEGQAEYNEILALNRAKAVKNYLVHLGIPEEQLEVKNYGSRVANEERTDNNISLDRRVEIIIMENQ